MSANQKKRQKIDVDLLPFDVQDGLVAFGNKIAMARRARNYTQADLATRAGIGLNTLIAIEKGSPSVQLGSYVMVLWCMDLFREFEQLARPEDDPFIINYATSRLSKP